MITDSIACIRKRNYASKVVKKFGLDLSGLTVFTEAATGNYLYTPIIAALAGARKVFAVSNDSRYGSKEQVKKITMNEAESLGVDAQISVIFSKEEDALKESDIVTNSGFVRPITREMISFMKPSAVIPLMWETWEFRENDLDLGECRKKGILVLGTNERCPQLNIFQSLGFIACKLLFEHGFDVYKDKLLVIASGYLGEIMCNFFIKNGIEFSRVVFDNTVPANQRSFIFDRNDLESMIDSYDAVIMAENYYSVDLISRDGYIPTELLKRKNPYIQLLHICGSINKEDIVKDGLNLFPKEIAKFSYMSISADYLSYKSTLELNTAGLKVGEIMARCRAAGMSVEETIKYAVGSGLAMDFER